MRTIIELAQYPIPRTVLPPNCRCGLQHLFADQSRCGVLHMYCSGGSDRLHGIVTRSRVRGWLQLATFLCEISETDHIHCYYYCYADMVEWTKIYLILLRMNCRPRYKYIS